MKRGVKLQNYPITKLQNRQNRSRGYILITLMLFVALLAIAAMAVLPKIAFQIKRDREEEMIHRALQYSRAVKRYYKKFGRYPSRLEELENTNNIRFLRKRYQDPITGKDFKLLHLSDVMLNSGPVMGQPAGQKPGGGMPPSGPLSSNPPPGTVPPPPANTTDQSASGANSSTPPNGQTDANASVSSSSSSSSSDTSSSTQQVFGGAGPILGVASTSKGKTIREFNDKKRYNDWLFIYDPQSDRGGMLNTPVQPGAGPGQVAPNAGPPQGSPPRPQGPPNPEPMPPEQ